MTRADDRRRSKRRLASLAREGARDGTTYVGLKSDGARASTGRKSSIDRLRRSAPNEGMPRYDAGGHRAEAYACKLVFVKGVLSDKKGSGDERVKLRD